LAISFRSPRLFASFPSLDSWLAAGWPAIDFLELISSVKRIINGKGAGMRKPRGYRQAAAEQVFGLFVLTLPYYQAILYAGISGLLSFLLLTCLLTFIVANSPAIRRTLASCLKALPLSWMAPKLDRRERWVHTPLFAALPGPTLAPSFQRPPPLYS
jgi:hypothetical protein